METNNKIKRFHWLNQTLITFLITLTIVITSAYIRILKIEFILFEKSYVIHFFYGVFGVPFLLSMLFLLVGIDSTEAIKMLVS